MTHVPLDFAEPGNAVVLTEVGETGAETLNGSAASTIRPGPTSPLVLAAASERVY